MKNLKYIAVIVLGVIFATMGCSSDDLTPTPDLQAEQLLVLKNGGSSWVAGSVGTVAKDGFDVTSQYSDFALTLGEFTYTVENSAGTAWPSASGTWSFANEQGTVMTRDDGIEITVSVSGDVLTLSFAATAEGGRVNSVEGGYVFTLVSE